MAHTQFRKRNTNIGAGEVSGVDMKKLMSGVKWSGIMVLHLTSEREECFVSECEWPVKSGKIWYACASTGLLFDKQSGACRQSTHVRLDLTSLKPDKMTSAEVRAWIKKRQDQSYEWSQIKLRRGPKPKGSVQEPAVEDDYVEVE